MKKLKILPVNKTYVSAIFIGKDGSCGYQKDKKYILILGRDLKTGSINIKRESDEEGSCEYSNILKFLDNWDNISNVDYYC
jgi:hypothetical protein